MPPLGICAVCAPIHMHLFTSATVEWCHPMRCRLLPCRRVPGLCHHAGRAGQARRLEHSLQRLQQRADPAAGLQPARVHALAPPDVPDTGVRSTCTALSCWSGPVHTRPPPKQAVC